MPLWRFETPAGEVFEMNTCPLPRIGEFSKAMMRLHGHWSRGILAEAGGLIDQPNRYVEAMETIDGIRAAEAARDADR